MLSITLILLIVIGLITTGLLVYLIKKRKNSDVPYEPDYRSLFIMGITFFPLGITLSISTDNPGFYGIGALGLIYMLIALVNKDKWEPCCLGKTEIKKSKSTKTKKQSIKNRKKSSKKKTPKKTKKSTRKKK